MAFLESPRFPECFALQAVRGGPAFSTDIAQTISGAEFRNINWDQGLSSWVVGYAAKPLSEFKMLRDFFRGVRGRGHGFRLRDPLDHSAAIGDGVVLLISGDNYQMYRRYSTGGALFEDKIIHKPVAGTIVVAGGGTYTIDHATGIITRTAGAVPTGWSGEYDKPARFDSDRMEDARVVDKLPGGELLVEWGVIPIVEQRSPS
jgi:uncharacterized protein (TIGR02217 family)